MIKKLILAAGLISLLGSSAFASGNMGKKKKSYTPTKSKFNVDKASTKVKWTGKKIGGSHWGSLKVSSGFLSMEDGHLVGGEFVIDMTSIKLTDKTPKEKIGDLEGHLKADDFFGTNNHKTAKLVMKHVMLGKGGVYNVNGLLTVKGIEKPILFNVDLNKSGSKVTGTSKITFNRTHYGIKYKSKSFFSDLGNRVIYDDVTVDVTLVAKK